MKTQVAIIGGGLAGLNAARLLHRAGVDFQLFEARDRLGGRILTVDQQGSPGTGGVDLGPSWFWPDAQPAISALVSDLGIESFAQCSEGDVLFERMSRERPHRYAPVNHQGQSMRMHGGTIAIVDALAAQVPADRIHLMSLVRQIELRQGGVSLSISTEKAGRPCEVQAEHVIAALPPRLFAQSARFVPDIDAPTRARWEATPTWMAPHAKFVAFYDRPFWRDAGLCGTAQSMVGPMAEIHDASGTCGAALFGFVGMGPSQRVTAGEAGLTDACVAQLVRLFGPMASTPSSTLVKDWARDTMTAAFADIDAPGHPSGASCEPSGDWEGRLHMAGSESSASEPGYLAGAVEASARTAAELARLLGR
ncbi:FAD-dependent oxidoreductase [Frigidibacter sp. MR17.14]|uniref:flavin monoamine oxidase family protein n=1 Tax=Frigidibacter sp. MR17.14 TaxID=3126509 RepID=UPI003012C48A